MQSDQNDSVSTGDEELEMPPEGKLEEDELHLLEQWIRRGAPGPKEDLGDPEFSRLGDQALLFDQAADGPARQPAHRTARPQNEGTPKPLSGPASKGRYRKYR